MSGSTAIELQTHTLRFRLAGDDHDARFLVQPEQCRDDPDPACTRRFAITGELRTFGTVMRCYVPIRNDTQTGYVGQSLTGVCQNPFGASFSLELFRP